MISLNQNEVLEIISIFDVNFVSVYALAIDNFNTLPQRTYKDPQLLTLQKLVRSARNAAQHRRQNQPLPAWGSSGSGQSQRNDLG